MAQEETGLFCITSTMPSTLPVYVPTLVEVSYQKYAVMSTLGSLERGEINFGR